MVGSRGAACQHHFPSVHFIQPKCGAWPAFSHFVSTLCAGLLPGQVFPTSFTIVNYDGLQVSDYGTYQKDAPGWCLQATEATSSVTSTYQWITASGCSALRRSRDARSSSRRRRATSPAPTRAAWRSRRADRRRGSQLTSIGRLGSPWLDRQSRTPPPTRKTWTRRGATAGPVGDMRHRSSGGVGSSIRPRCECYYPAW